MLVLSRRIGEEIVIGAAITVRVARLSRSQVSLAIDAPKSVHVLRREIQPNGNGKRPARETNSSTAQADAPSLRSAIKCMIADSRMRYRPEIEFCDDLDGDVFRPELHAAVVSIVRELVVNACRHSKSKNVLVGLTQDEGCLCVQVQDWGRGFDPANLPPHKQGLKGIRELAGWLGGTARIDSQCGAGTCVIVEVPLVQKTELEAPARHCRPKRTRVDHESTATCLPTKSQKSED